MPCSVGRRPAGDPQRHSGTFEDRAAQTELEKVLLAAALVTELLKTFTLAAHRRVSSCCATRSVGTRRDPLFRFLGARPPGAPDARNAISSRRADPVLIEVGEDQAAKTAEDASWSATGAGSRRRNTQRLSRVQPGGWLDHAPVRRNRPRTHDFGDAGQTDGGADLGRERGRIRKRVSLHRVIHSGGAGGRDAAAAAAQHSSPHRRRQCGQLPHPRGAAVPGGMLRTCCRGGAAIFAALTLGPTPISVPARLLREMPIRRIRRRGRTSWRARLGRPRLRC